jgi:AcrR family transcriptional regulator
MGRRPKSQEEIKEFKNKLLDVTLQLISKEGYAGFSIRKLGPAVGIAPKTVYNYFKSKEEIYLHIITKGFELLYQALSKNTRVEEDPFKKLEALAAAYVRFGLEQSNYYDLMFTWHVPKYNDFKGTDLEPLAFTELQTALKSFDLLLQTIEQLAQRHKCIRNEDSRVQAIQLLASIHGIVALKNNTILDYIHDDVDAIIGSLLEGILKPFRPMD